MTTMTLNIPDALEKEHDETVRLIAAKLYEAGKFPFQQGLRRDPALNYNI